MTTISPKTPPSACDPRSPERQHSLAEKREQLAKKGITDQQKQAGWGSWSERLAERVRPRGYLASDGGKNAHPGRTLWTLAHDVFSRTPHWREKETDTREDAWRMYLGLPQEHGTFQISADVPKGTCAAPNAEYYRVANLNHSDERFVDLMLREQRGRQVRGETAGDDTGAARYLLTDGYFTDSSYGFDAGPLGQFSATVGQDEQGDFVEYRDTWDLDPKVLGIRVPAELIAGNPFEVYGKLPFDRAKATRVVELEDELIARLARSRGSALSIEELKETLKRDERVRDVSMMDVSPKDAPPDRWPRFWMAKLEDIVHPRGSAELPEKVRPQVEELARLDPRYENPVFSKTAAPW